MAILSRSQFANPLLALTPAAATGNDLLIGTINADSIDGLAGDDTIWGLGGNDVIVGGDGNDRISGGDGDDFLRGGAGNDFIAGGDGNDVIRTDLGLATVNGGAGNDSIYSVDGLASTIFGGDGDDYILGSFDAAGDRILGGNGNDYIDGLYGNDTLCGGDGNDFILSHGLGPGSSGSLINAGLGDDIVRSGESDDTVYGGAGHDEIKTGDGNDLIFGGSGNDRIVTGTGRDWVFDGEGHDSVILGGEGAIVTGATRGDNIFIAANPDGPGHRTLHYAGNFHHITADLAGAIDVGLPVDGWPSAYIARDDYATGFDRFVFDLDGGALDVTGTDRPETIIVDVVRQSGMVLHGGGGDDTIRLSYQQNPDNIKPWIYGGDGNDWLMGGSDGDHLDGGAGNDTIICGASGPTFYDRDEANGGDGDDLLIGGVANPGSTYALTGGAGNDTIRAGTGAIVFYSDSYTEDGNDLIIGGMSNDTIFLDSGADRVTGGGGADLFAFDATYVANPDGSVVLDFNSLEGDKLQFYNLHFIGTNDFRGIGVGGEVRYEVRNGNALVQADVDGNGITDFTVKLVGVTMLTVNDLF